MTPRFRKTIFIVATIVAVGVGATVSALLDWKMKHPQAVAMGCDFDTNHIPAHLATIKVVRAEVLSTSSTLKTNDIIRARSPFYRVLPHTIVETPMVSVRVLGTDGIYYYFQRSKLRAPFLDEMMNLKPSTTLSAYVSKHAFSDDAMIINEVVAVGHDEFAIKGISEKKLEPCPRSVFAYSIFGQKPSLQ